MPEYSLPLTRIFLYKDKFYDSVLKWESGLEVAHILTYFTQCGIKSVEKWIFCWCISIGFIFLVKVAGSKCFIVQENL